MEQKKYWQSFGELNRSNAYEVAANDEFREDLPFEADDKGFLDAKTPRRDFLKYLGFSTAAATLAASCEVPARHAIPFVNKPEEVIPGVANYFATTYVQNGDVVSVVAKVRDGRPIKIEGNELSPLTEGGTSARVQASVLDLYDNARLRYPMQMQGEKDFKEVSTFEAFDKMIGQAMTGLGGAAVVLLTGSITSPTTKEVIAQFLSKYPGSRHVMYDAVSYAGMLLANESTYGKRAIPSYRFDKAKVIVSLGADFLGTWLSPVEYARQYSKNRKLSEKNSRMSRHIQFESMMSMTGANADERYHHKPSETGAIALALYSALGGAASPVTLSGNVKKGLDKTIKYLNENKGAALVVCGSNDPSIQIVVNGINEILGAGGSTIDWSATFNGRQGIDADMVKLVADMNSGAVGALLVHGVNPVYNYFDSKKFTDGLQKVKLSVSFNTKMDETTERCKYVIPDHHYLESWGDAEVKTGYYSFMQPTIYPLFKTRQWQDSLLKWSGGATDYPVLLKNTWTAKLGGQDRWDKALQDGVINPGGVSVPPDNYSNNSPVSTGASHGINQQADSTGNTAPASGSIFQAPSAGRSSSFNSGGVAAAVTAIQGSKAGGTELVLYEKVSIGSGEQANNPWLQELPDPVTKATWDNYAIISPAMALSMFDIDLSKNGDTDAYEVHPDKQTLKITVRGVSQELPIIIVPGTNPNTIAVALGYGCSEKIGPAANGAGKNAFPWVGFNSSTREYNIGNVTLEKGGSRYTVAQNQTHGSYEGRTDVVLETTTATLRGEPEMFSEVRGELYKDYSDDGNFRDKATLYPAKMNVRPGIHWGMSVDMNSCIGCGACVVACNAENNVAVVGKAEVARSHDMHWIRIDRYFSGDPESPHVVFQPMLCQHCDNAPCENVCPVSATNHSMEGLNQMIYNRCIGTRYCANNCPYKVRRFNWADYMGADSFPDNQEGHITDAAMMMNDDLTRMVLNPDVTVRSRGVIEKCSFCVQRLQEGKLKAKKESRPLKTGENNEWDVKVACQQACPTSAIVFGNVNDKNSALSTHRAENNQRLFYALDMIHTLPNVNYLAKVRNSDEIIEQEGGKAAASKEPKEVEHVDGGK